MNKSGNPVPVVLGNSGTPLPVTVGNTSPIPVLVTNPAPAGGGSSSGWAAPEDGAQFFKEGVTTVLFTSTEIFGSRTGQRFVVDFLTLTAALTSADCSLMHVRVDDGNFEYARTIMKMDGNAANLFGESEKVTMYIDPGQRLLAMAFPTPGCNSTDLRVSVVGHFVAH